MKSRFPALLLLWLISLASFGQGSRMISGKVADGRDNSPLIGATINVKGTSKGAITDVRGSFKYLVDSPDISNVTLVVSYIGYKSQSVKLKDQTVFEFLLEEDASSLDEVVITSSYGTRKLKQEVVGSITNIKTKDLITEQSVASFDQLLEGQSAGVYVESSAEVGKSVNIQIRGQGSLTSLSGSNVGTSTQPLIIVDGIRLSEDITIDGNSFFDAGTDRFSESAMNPLAKIGIKDIESINILKDAAAVSLYGSDGANGVIIITTKGGSKGPMKFSFSSQGGVSTSVNRMEYMNGEQYQEMRNLYYRNSGQPSSVQDWNGVNTDWYSLLNRNGSFQSYDFSASGGTDHLKFRTSLGYSNIKEPQIGNDFIKYNTGLSLRYENKKFNATLKVSPSLTEKNTPNTLYSFAVPPTVAPFDSSGEYTSFDFYGNPLAVANQNRGLVRTKAALSSINSSYAILENLVLSTMFGLDFSNKNQDTYFSGLNETGMDDDGNQGLRMLRTRNTRTWNWNANLNFQKQFNENHYFDLLAGVETRQNNVNLGYSKGRGFPTAGDIYPVEQATLQDYRKDKSETSGRSFFAQTNYNLKKKYFLLGNFRIDQSSAFGRDNNTSYNGGIGASWVISSEPFLSEVKWVENLRLRASYGSSGNSRIGSYRALGLYSVYDKSPTGYNQGYYASPSTAPNPNLGWEKNYKFNLGLDLVTSFRVSTTIEYFYDNISDMIVSRETPPEIGYTDVQINGSDMYNRGIEVSFRGHIIARKNFKWTSQFNFSRIENKVTHLQGLGSDYSISQSARAQKIGYSTSVIWGYNYEGVDPATGRELYSIDGNIVDAISLYRYYGKASDWVPIGNSQPDLYGGLNNRFHIGKSLEISVVMSYAWGASSLVQKELVDQYRLLTNRNLSLNAYYDSWKEPGDIALYPSIVNNNPLISNSSKYLYNNSSVKLKSVNISYKIPLQNKKILKSANVFANGTNLYNWYYDKSPEGMNGIRELRTVYPEMLTVSFGLNANF